MEAVVAPGVWGRGLMLVLSSIEDVDDVMQVFYAIIVFILHFIFSIFFIVIIIIFILSLKHFALLSSCRSRNACSVSFNTKVCAGWAKEKEQNGCFLSGKGQL